MDHGGETLSSIFGCQPVSSYSHLIAAGAALAASLPLVRLAQGHKARKLALSVYVSCVVVALAISGTYHSLDDGPERAFMRRLDYFAIWALIAGTFTAVHGTVCRGFWRTGVLAITWTYAAIGIFLQACWWETFTGNVGLALYLGLGWIGIASIIKLGRELGFAAVLPIVYSGVAFSLGAVLEAVGWPTLIADWIGAHEVFHFAVIAGVALNWLFVRRLLVHHLPRLQAMPEPVAVLVRPR